MDAKRRAWRACAGFALAICACLAQAVHASTSTNVALALNGATAIASSQAGAGYPVSAVINGETSGIGWSIGGGWQDATADQYPDWVEIDFAQASQIDHVVVYTLQDQWASPSPPTDTLTFTQYGVTAFDVQAWDGSAWQILGRVTGNILVKRTVSFAAVTTSRIRIVVNASLSSFSRITEIEAWTGTGSASGSINVARASTGGLAFASSQYSNAFPVGAVIDDETAGAGWSLGGGWADATVEQYPDWVEVDFPQPSEIDHVVVYTVQDNWQSPVQPTDALTFTRYGVTAFDVQVWSGSAWQTVGSVTGNRYVKRTVTFPAVMTSRIRIMVNAALASLSRITEIEAWTPGGGTTAWSNVALASNGSTASASSQYNGAFPVSAVIDGESAGASWSNGGGWADATVGQYPDWVEIDFPVQESIGKVVVYTVQDNWQSPSQPTDTMTFGLYGITDFDVQGWDGAQWVTLASVAGNNLVKRTVTFNAFSTSHIRIHVRNALNSLSRITEVEAWGAPLTGPAGTNVALGASGASASASSQYTPGFPVSAVIDGDRAGLNWSNGGGWADGTIGQYPDWVEVDFNGSKTLNTVIVYTLQDNWQAPVEPTDTMTFTQYGITDFQVQAWDGSTWQAIGMASGNNLVKRSFNVSVTTTKIRVLVTQSLASLSRITEIEAFGN